MALPRKFNNVTRFWGIKKLEQTIWKLAQTAIFSLDVDVNWKSITFDVRYLS